MVEDKSVQQMQATGARVLQNTPGMAEKLVSSSKAQLRPPGAARDDRDTTIADLQRQLESERERNRDLEDSYKYRVATFMKREVQTKNKIDALEKRLNDGPEGDEHSKRMSFIHDMHGSVVSGLECIQNNTAKILQDQEKDLMRAFRQRLQDCAKELEAQRSRKGEDSSQLLIRHRKVVADLHEAEELAATFDKKNQELSTENKKLLEKLRTREDDRAALWRELVQAKKEAARLKAQAKEGAGGAETQPGSQQKPSQQQQAAKSPARSFSQRQVEQARLQSTHNRQYEREVAYREAIQKLKRMVEAERRTARSLRQQQADMLQQRTELEVLLRQCLDDVKGEMLRHRLAPDSTSEPTLPGAEPPANSVQVHELRPSERERVLELLLSQQRVVQLLYSKTFAAYPSPQSADAEEEEASATTVRPAKEDDFSWLSDIIPPGDM